MYLKLIRNKPSGKAIFGRLLVDCENVSGFQSFKLQMDTLEHTDYAIPSGFYRLRITMSPRFKELLPILDGVWGYRSSGVQEVRGSGVTSELPNSKASEPRSTKRSGIRIHAGNTIEHTTGCILVGERLEAKGERLLSSRKALKELLNYLLNYQKEYPKDEIYIEIIEPNDYPMYDVPYERQLQEP
jgi:hypothetical protein